MRAKGGRLVGLARDGSSSLRRVWAWLAQTYATVDPRSIGVCRILLALLIFADVARRYRDLDAYYTNLGWLTNHFSLFHPMSTYVFSIYHAFSTPEEVRVLFFAHCCINVLFLIGYKTRLTQLLAIVLLTSLNSRNIIIENGGFVMLVLLAIWTWFLPMGRRFSVDAWLLAWKARRETTLSELNDRSWPRSSAAPVVSLAVFAVILQWAINYFMNAIQKNGPTWHDGTAIYYFVQQARLLHPFGVWLGDHIPIAVLKALTHGTLIVEGAIAFLWVSPIFHKAARMFAWFLGIGLHLGIFAFATLGPFVWIMMIPYAMFIPREAWEWSASRLRRRRRHLALLLDESSTLNLALGRVVKRLDSLELVRFVAVHKPADRRDVVVVTAGRTERGVAAVQQLFSALPWPRWLSRMVGRVGGARLLRSVLARLLSKPTVWEQRLGLNSESHSRARRPSRASIAMVRVARLCGTGTLLLLLYVSATQVCVENRAVPAWLKPGERPEWIVKLITYPRLFQGWSMFAPDPPREDGWVVVDGRTVDGRKVDPLTGKQPNFSLDLPGGPDFSAQWEAFHMRIFEKRFSLYYPGFEEYLKRYDRITGNPNDQLVAFDVWYINRTIYPPGRGFGPTQYRKLFSFGQVKDSGVRAETALGAAPESGIGAAPESGPGTPLREQRPLKFQTMLRQAGGSPASLASAVQRASQPPPPTLEPPRDQRQLPRAMASAIAHFAL